MHTPQTPIRSGFSAFTTATEAATGIDLTGKVAIVTGGYSGLGLEAARVLSAAGAAVIVPARNLDKARAALANVPRLELASLNLIDPASVEAFAQQFMASGRPLHILINSAGIMASPFARDSRGYEEQFATNHLGHFQLTARLWPALIKAKGARVVSVTSRAHFMAGVDFDDVHFERRDYNRWTAYGQSKTANALFAVALDARGREHGVRAFSVHPGAIVTNLARHMPSEEMRAFGAVDEAGYAVIDPERGKKTVGQGAATNVWCATSQKLDGMGGVYCEDCDIAIAIAADSSEKVGVKPWASDADLAERLWKSSETLLK